MDTAIEEVKRLASNLDEVSRRKLIVVLHELADSLEDSNDTIHRFGYLHLQTAAVKTGFDLGLFKYLVAAKEKVDVERMAQKTGAEVEFLRRYLSYLASIGVLKQFDEDHYIANNVTHNLSEQVSEAGISHCFQTISTQYQTIPSFLQKTGYRNPTNELNTVFQQAWNTDLHAFAWFSSHPNELKHFNDYMAFRREPKLSWLTVYPVEEETQNWPADKPVYVNIGGGIGHQCAQFKEKYPNVSGRVILQDLPHSIEKALQTPGVENMVHNFFEEQPIKGAKFYFSRGVLHNHPDHKVRQLLLNTKAAMESDSIMLLDEMVLPRTNVNSYAAAMDLTMMSAFAASERSEAQWEKIIDDVGLKLDRVYEYNPVSYESVMEVRLP
ncbi:S-adenosyl-L-methionine-dependent methyltransferase [Corynespora cassiicola Philippines]|uniref:S-adenosyl-L-methionine-dependent methyltransferase n=1 Tax=Corynespora cassiicola Philippines TaxID=1448308 RepID=A0A2T2P2B0_CORCC|nr:S-adenosyl-L-methionine-dependent methyltransferase [Corynespora cassiicola Philippines]